MCPRCGGAAVYPPGVGRPAIAHQRVPPLLTGEVIGYRFWSLQEHELRSGNAGLGRWKLGEPNKAECYRTRYQNMWHGSRSRLGPDIAAAEQIGPDNAHQAPHPSCECGLYAVYEIQDAGRFYAAGTRVWGAVKAWGRMEAHAAGFRAEYAQPVLLAYDPDQPYRQVTQVMAIASEFEIPVVPLDDLEDAAGEFGQEVPEGLRPPRPAAKFVPAFHPLPPFPGAMQPVATSFGRFASGGAMPFQAWSRQFAFLTRDGAQLTVDIDPPTLFSSAPSIQCRVRRDSALSGAVVEAVEPIEHVARKLRTSRAEFAQRANALLGGPCLNPGVGRSESCWPYDSEMAIPPHRLPPGAVECPKGHFGQHVVSWDEAVSASIDMRGGRIRCLDCGATLQVDPA